MLNENTINDLSYYRKLVKFKERNILCLKIATILATLINVRVSINEKKGTSTKSLNK